MSKGQMSTMFEEDFDSLKLTFEEDGFFFDSDSVSDCSDDENEEDIEILEKLVQLKREEEQREKDLQQIKKFPVDIRMYNWQTPVTKEGNKTDGFPGLLESLTPLPRTEESMKSKKGAGFTKHVPKVVYGTHTDISVKPAMCLYFLKGKCTSLNCAFYHPVNEKCKFDKTCTNPKCVFVHSSSENKTPSVQSIVEHKNKPQNNEKCKHRICLNMFQIVDKKVVATQKKCKHGDNCNFAHTIKEITTAIQSNEEKFKCKYGYKCKHISLEMSKSVIKDKPTKIFKYQNKTEFCECPRVHTKESIQDFIVRVHTSRRPPQKNNV